VLASSALFALAFTTPWYASALIPYVFPGSDDPSWALEPYKPEDRARPFGPHYFTSPDVAAQRDLSRYRKAGPYTSWPWDASGDCGHIEREAPKARAFIVRHWKAKRRAYVVINIVKATMTPTRDLAIERQTAHIFVEPAGGGAWRVVWRNVASDGTIRETRIFSTVTRERGKTTICHMNEIEVAYTLRFTSRDRDDVWNL